MTVYSDSPDPRAPISETDLCRWLGSAAPGDVLEYYRGFLALDASPVLSRIPEALRRAVAGIGNRAAWAAALDLAHLLQRRNGPDDFSYLIIARRRPKGVPVALASLLNTEAV
ncbi:MAG: hypothetical protein HQL34_05320 [Alphaproteobacteria bacterium]|nr:hypothetical protein [Alphaproteobacteria bacterium]